MSKVRKGLNRRINAVTGVTRVAQFGRNKKGQAISKMQRRRDVYAATRKAAGLSAG